MADQSQILIQALKDRFSAESPAQASELPDVIPAKNPNGPTLLRIPGTDSYEPLEKPRHLDSLPLEEKEQIKADAERRQQERVAVAKKLAEQIESDHYKALIEGAQPPCGATGRPDRVFFESLKHVWKATEQACKDHPEMALMTNEEKATFLEASPELIDYKATWGLRELILRGYEASKGARPGRQLAPVGNDEILAEVQKIVNPESPKIVNNRYVRS